ncbi:MAG: hypothetical protein QGG40_15760 [Myxococcota bacterium]|nr:hypothetical protein [Myxococcota bacterium]
MNGVRADGLRDFDFVDVSVRVDVHGNIWIDGPQYQVEIEGEATSAPVPTESTRTTKPASLGGRFWLVTEDAGSRGHRVQISVNGVAVHTVRSGQAQVVLDLGPYLKRGRNDLHFVADAQSPGGGVLYIHVGEGSNQAGAVVMPEPAVTFARNASSGTQSSKRAFQLNVD